MINLGESWSVHHNLYPFTPWTYPTKMHFTTLGSNLSILNVSISCTIEDSQVRITSWITWLHLFCCFATNPWVCRLVSEVACRIHSLGPKFLWQSCSKQDTTSSFEDRSVHPLSNSILLWSSCSGVMPYAMILAVVPKLCLSVLLAIICPELLHLPYSLFLNHCLPSLECNKVRSFIFSV